MITTNTCFKQLKLSRLESLPTEIVQHILSLLPPPAFLYVKFTSKTMYAFTKDSFGNDLINMKDGMSNRSYAAMMVWLEHVHMRERKMDRITCSLCAKRKQNARNGFNDAHFNRSRLDRQCLRCLTFFTFSLRALQSFKVKGEKMFVCYMCDKVIEETRVGEKSVGPRRGQPRTYKVCRSEWCQRQA